MRLHELISTSTYPFKKKEDDGDFTYRFDADGFKYWVDFNEYYDDDGIVYEGGWNRAYYEMHFGTFDTMGADLSKKRVFKIFGTIEKITYDFLDTESPDVLFWDSDQKRLDIYSRFKHPNYKRFEDLDYSVPLPRSVMQHKGLIKI